MSGRLLSYPGDVVYLDGTREVVREACGAPVTAWVCLHCGVRLPSQFYLELHTAKDFHAIARQCAVHGPEATA